jgi:hypothetical protein
MDETYNTNEPSHMDEIQRLSLSNVDVSQHGWMYIQRSYISMRGLRHI